MLCIECGDDVHPVRVGHGFKTCIDCARTLPTPKPQVVFEDVSKSNPSLTLRASAIAPALAGRPAASEPKSTRAYMPLQGSLANEKGRDDQKPAPKNPAHAPLFSS